MLPTILVLLLANGCGGSASDTEKGQTKAESSSAQPQSSQTAEVNPTASAQGSAAKPSGSAQPPPEIMASLRSLQRTGEMLFQHDQLIRRSIEQIETRRANSDCCKEEYGEIIVEDKGQGAIVHFLSKGDMAEKLNSIYRVLYMSSKLDAGSISSQSTTLPNTLIAKARAQMFAKKVSHSNFAKRYQVVTLPASMLDKSGWLVYWLALGESSEELILTGHIRMHISADGQKLVENLPLAQSSVRAPKPKPNVDPKNAFIPMAHSVTPGPLETHVYTSLTIQYPLQVGATTGLWRIDGSRISYEGPPPGPNRPYLQPPK